MKIINLAKNNSIINYYLTQLRDKDMQHDRLRFKTNIVRIGTILAYEASKYIDYGNKSIETPFMKTNSCELINHPILYCIVRAGITMIQGAEKIFDNSNIAYFVGTHVHTIKHVNFVKSSNVNNKVLIIADPITTTGDTIKLAIESIRQYGIPSKVIILSIIATPMSIENLSKLLSDDSILITCSIDNFSKMYKGTRPGIGDIGDLLFG